MKVLHFITLLASVTALAGCTNLQRLAHVYSNEALAPTEFRYSDGGNSLYYSFVTNEGFSPADTLIFFYGGSGCSSWKYVMPNYIHGLSEPARVFALNKRFVSDRSTGMFGCSEDFNRSNNPDQWVSDYIEFISEQIQTFPEAAKNIILIGVSEGALTAVRVAGMMPEVTHLVIIGDGGYSMRKSLVILRDNGLIHFDVASGWQKIVTDSHSIEKKWYGNTYRWWSDILDIDPMPYFLKLNIPILVGIGEKDESVPVESARYLETRFKEEGKNNLTLIIYPGADHRLASNGISYRFDFFSKLHNLLQQDL